MTAERKVLAENDVKRALTRIAHEILERNHGIEHLALMGIRTRGAYLAKRLQAEIKNIEGTEVPLGILDITLYRDDLGEIGATPEVRETELDFDLAGKILVLVDDVLYTGRTVRAALDAIVDFGRPQAIQLAVLIDRGHRELPIKADFVGKNIPTSQKEQVVLRLREQDNCDEAVVCEGKKA